MYAVIARKLVFYPILNLTMNETDVVNNTTKLRLRQNGLPHGLDEY
jgi:hypothetical protein